jgi:hypothetical protein
MNLFQIDDAIMACIDQETGDILDVEKLDALEMEREKKISNTACFIKNLRAEAEAIKAEKMKMADRQKAKENLADRLENYLANYLGGLTYEDEKCAISYRKSTSTEIAEDLDLSTLPDGCKKIKIEADKTAIKKALQNGEKIDGCTLVVKNNIQIK